MGCAGSKTSRQDGGKNKPKKDKNKSSNNGTHVQAPVAPTTPKLSEKKDEINLDRNLINFINLHNRDIINFIVNEVKDNLQIKKQFQSNTASNGNESKQQQDDDTKVDLDGFISDVTSRAIQFCKNGKAKTYTQLNQLLKESKLPSIEDKNLICDLVVDVLHKYLIIINDNKLNKDFNLNDYVDNLKKQNQQQQQQEQQQQKKQQEQIEADKKSEEPLKKDDSKVVDGFVETSNDRVLSWNEANKIARLLFLTNRAQPNIHASSLVKKGYIVTKVKTIDNRKTLEVALTAAEIDDILNPKAANSTYINSGDLSSAGANNSINADNNLVNTADNTSQLSLDENLNSLLNNYSNLISNNSNLNNETLNDSLNNNNNNNNNNQQLDNSNSNKMIDEAISLLNNVNEDNNVQENNNNNINNKNEIEVPSSLVLEVLNSSQQNEHTQQQQQQQQNQQSTLPPSPPPTPTTPSPLSNSQISNLQNFENKDKIEEINNIQLSETSTWQDIVEPSNENNQESLSVLKPVVVKNEEFEEPKPVIEQVVVDQQPATTVILSTIQNLALQLNNILSEENNQNIVETAVEPVVQEKQLEPKTVEKNIVEEQSAATVILSTIENKEVKPEPEKIEDNKDAQACFVTETIVEVVAQPVIEPVFQQNTEKVEDNKDAQACFVTETVVEVVAQPVLIEKPVVEDVQHSESLKLEENQNQNKVVEACFAAEPKIETVVLPIIEPVVQPEPQKVVEEQSLNNQNTGENKVDEIKPAVQSSPIEKPAATVLLSTLQNLVIQLNNENAQINEQQVPEQSSKENQNNQSSNDDNQKVPTSEQNQNNNNNNNVQSNQQASVVDVLINNILPSQTEQGKLDEVVKQSLLDDRFYNNNSFKESPPVNDSKNDEAATKIQSSFRSHQVRDDLEKSKASEAAPIKNSPQEPPKVEHESHLKEAILSESAVVKHEEDLNDAAVRIQSTFRGYMTRKNLEGKESKHENGKAEVSSSQQEQKIKHDESLQQQPQQQQQDAANIDDITNLIKQIESDANNSTVNSEGVDDAAVKIQSVFRGYSTRKSISEINNNQQLNQEVVDESASKMIDEAISLLNNDTNNDSKNVDEAATKIQASYRGYKTRKELIEIKSNTPTNNVTSNEATNIEKTSDENNNAGNQSQAVTDNKNDSKSKEELDAAAVKIQATFRGYQTRRELSGKK